MRFGKKLITATVCLIIAATSPAYSAKSVFIISKHSTPSQAQAYAINGTQVDYQAQVGIDTYNPGYGAVGNAIWSDKELMFVTYEGSGMIVWASTKALKKIGEFDTGVYNLAGIAVDANREKIYIVQRGTNNLYVYTFNQVNNTLILDNHYSLEVPSGYLNAWGLALDETNGLLYISTDTERVHVYDTTDWSYDHYIDINVGGTNQSAVGIAIDPIRGYLYTGDWDTHNYLVRTNIATQASIEVEVTNGWYGMPVIGIDVDDETGLVYCTTYHHDFRVYDWNLVLKDTETNGISGPAGVAVGGWYKTPSFTLVKDNTDPNNECVYPWDPNEENYLVFDIYWDANSHPDTNVVVVDQLPDELDYDSSIPEENDYNEFDKIVKWTIGNIGAGASGHIVLKTKVNNWARPCDTITNTVIMEGDTYLNESRCDVNVCPWGSEIIYVDEDANGFNNGTSWADAYTDLQDALAAARRCGPSVTAIWIAAGTYKPVKNIDIPDYQDKSFEIPANVALFGHFPPEGIDRGEPLDRNFADANNETILDGQIGTGYEQAVQYIVKAQDVANGLVDGFTIRGSYYYDGGSNYGAGVYLNDSNACIVNCKIKDNYSYGIYAEYYSYPDIHNCTFSDNDGYGIYICDHCWPEITNCIFDGNHATAYGLGESYYSAPIVDECLFKNHTFYAIYGSGGALTITDCSIVDNSCGLYLSDVYTTLSRCLVKQSSYSGLRVSDSYLAVGYSTIANNNSSGLFVSDCDLIVDHSIIANNNGNGNGIYTENGCELTMDRSVVRYSGEHGIELNDNLLTTIKNSWIHNNGTKQNANYGGAGICFNNQSSVPLIRNNTIYDNFTYGVESSHYGADPNIVNCIIYSNDSNDLYRENGSFNKVNYCLLQHPHTGTGNIYGDPCFFNPANDNLHIQPASICKDTGNPYANYSGEMDIDGEDRVKYGRVDIGADEYYLSLADFTDYGIVNFIDYAIFAGAWLTPNSGRSIDGDSDVDIYDLKLFCEDWLWQAPWDDGWMMCMGGGDGGLRPESVSPAESVLEADISKADSLRTDNLMLFTAAESMKARPKRLAAKSDKFYAVNALNTVLALRKAESARRMADKQAEKEIEQVDIEEILKWLDEIWLDPEVQKAIPEDEWLEFVKSIKECWEVR